MNLPIVALEQDKILFKEDFKNNKNKWHTQNDSDFVVYVKRGVLHLEKLYKNFDRRGCLWYYKKIPRFNTLNNFQVTVHAKYISGGDHSDIIDFVWGDKGEITENQLTSNIYQMNFLFSKGGSKTQSFL